MKEETAVSWCSICVEAMTWRMLCAFSKKQGRRNLQVSISRKEMNKRQDAITQMEKERSGLLENNGKKEG